MSQIEPNDFEERWRKAFEEASEPPSDKLWEGIERQLSPERPIGLPFFWVGAVLLLLGLGWWWMSASDTPSPAVITTHTAPASNRPVTGRTPIAGAPSANPGTSAQPDIPAAGDPAAGGRSVGTTAVKTPAPGVAHTKTATRQTASGNGPARAAVSPETDNDAYATAAPSARKLRAQGAGHYAAIHEGVTPPASSQPVRPEMEIPALLPVAVPPTRPVTLGMHAAAGKAWTLLPVNRQLTAPAADLPSLKRKTWKPTYWISANASFIRFDPHLTLSNDYVATLTNLYAGFNQSLGSAYVPANGVSRSKAGYDRKGSHISFLAEVAGGYAFSRHWYLEGGVSFLRGHSTITDNVVLIDRSSSTRSSIYNQYLMDSKAGSQNYQSAPSSGSGYLSSKNIVVYTSANPFRYTFEYLSVPVSVGYRFRPEKRLDYFVSAGVSADFFIKNTLKDDSDIAIPTAEYYPADGVYKNLSFSGTGAAGVSYRIRPRLSLTLKSFVRRNLTGGIHGDYLQIHPLTIGLGAGIRKEF